MCRLCDSTANTSKTHRPPCHRGTGITIPDAEGPLHETEGHACTPVIAIPSFLVPIGPLIEALAASLGLLPRVAVSFL